MATKKTQMKTVKKPSGALSLSDKERKALRKSAEADMKKYGFKTPEELAAYYDGKRGY